MQFAEVADVRTKPRNQILDVAKGIGIILVFLGHSLWVRGLAFGTIFAFHMPLFFFISGMLFKPDKYADMHRMLRHLAVAFLAPYIFFNLLALSTFWLSPWFPVNLRGILLTMYSVFIGCHPRTDGPTWFLVALAEVQFATWLVLRISKRNTLALLAAAAFIYVAGAFSWALWPPRFSRYMIPFRSLSAMLAFLYFVCGHVVAKYDWEAHFRRVKVPISMFAVLCAIVAVAVLTHRFGRNALDNPRNPYLFIVTSALGIFSVLAIAAKIAVAGKLSSALAYIGRNSLHYFTLEFVIGIVIWRIMKFFAPHLTWPFYLCGCHQGIAIVYFVVNMLAVSAAVPGVKILYGWLAVRCKPNYRRAIPCPR